MIPARKMKKTCLGLNDWRSHSLRTLPVDRSHQHSDIDHTMEEKDYNVTNSVIQRYKQMCYLLLLI